MDLLLSVPKLLNSVVLWVAQSQGEDRGRDLFPRVAVVTIKEKRVIFLYCVFFLKYSSYPKH